MQERSSSPAGLLVTLNWEVLVTLGRSRGLAEGSGYIGALGSEQWHEGAGFCTWDRAKPDTGPASEVSGWGALSREGSGGAGDSSSAGASSVPWQTGG